jgi:signal transduction histidine kinase
VDDNDELRNFMIELLSREHEVISARDGAEALAEIRRQPPDLLVSDVMMPVMTGVELCQAIKSDAQLSAIPVILLTARAGADATLEGFAHGADDFVAKPFHPRVLEARVRAQLRLRELGVELAQKEKLAAVGTLAAGVLHEVRNPVNAILNAAKVLMAPPGGRVLADDKKHKLLGVIAEGGERILGITKILDEHARPADGGMSAVSDLRAGLEGTLRLLEHRLETIEVEREYVDVRPALAPAGPVNQVLLNLVDNALKAGARKLTLSLSEPDVAHVLVRVGDDGSGISPESAARIFDPFVTGGNGSGLGLYVSRRIVEQHRGKIWCEPRDGGGTWFNVLLPVAADEPARGGQHG